MTQIEIFKAGKRYDANGVLKEITVADLEQTVAVYNPEYHEAPLVIGHPKSNNPAWGWVKCLSLDGDVLKADVDEVDAEFAEMVKDGKFKKVSAAFYLPDSPNNPHKGVLSLRHVGFLGAMPPAVKGLKQVEFAEDDSFIEFSDWGQASLFSRMREWIIGKFGIEEADKALPHFEVEWLKEDAMREQIQKQVQAESAVKPEPIFNEPQKTPTPEPIGETGMTQEEIDALKAENEKLKAEKAAADAEKAEIQAKQAEAALNAEKAANAEFCEGLVKEGKLAPVVKEKMVQALDALADIKASREPEFNEGEDVLSQFKTALSASPKILAFSEVATANKAQGEQVDEVQYAETDDPARIELDRRVQAYMKQHNVDYGTALAAVYQ